MIARLVTVEQAFPGFPPIRGEDVGAATDLCSKQVLGFGMPISVDCVVCLLTGASGKRCLPDGSDKRFELANGYGQGARWSAPVR